ncbi:MAG TPA: histidine kinase, partial [Saprospiraceae bacterium]|nr:histidine kinase [Saprospiraceae bacterium]
VHCLNQKQLIEGSDIVRNGFEGFTFAKNNNAFLYSDDIYKIDLQSGKAQQLKYDSYFNPNQQDIQYVGEDAAGNIWMSSFTLVGKYRLEGDSLAMLDAFTIDDGMISPTSIELHIDDQGRIWTFTISGMNCIDPVTREVRFFGINEGLPDSWIDPVQVITVSDGQIATHCANGMIVFDPVALWNSVTPSSEKVVINQIRIGGDALATKKSINSLGSLELMPGHGAVDIEFQGLAFPTDVRVEYCYRLKGLQDDWLSLGKNKLVTLPSLSPGTYTLEVKTGKPHSNAPIKSLAIVIGTPFFLRWWFIIISALILISAIIGIMQWRIRRIRRQEEARVEVSKKIAELELKALRSQMNPHFMFNSLNSIKNYILHAEPKLAAEYLSNFAHLIRMILQNSREKSISLKDELETLILYVDLEKLRFDDEFDFIYLVDDSIHLEDIKIPPMLLQPYVENAIWHGLMHKKVRGHLLLQFVKQDNMIACIIDDDGVGRENALKMKSLSATRYMSMGMGITQDRIEIMNKMDALGITSEIKDKHDASGKPAGTRVIVRIPASNDLYS